MKQIILIIGLGGVLSAQYIGSYTARLSLQDHYSSQGKALRSAGDILQQDRANYYRFGRRDREDTGAGYFATRERRAAFGRMLRRGMLSGDLAREIRYGSPLVRVDIYSRHLEVRSLSAASYPVRPASPPPYKASPTPQKSLSQLLLEDAAHQIITYAGSHDMGFTTTDIKHRMVGVYFAREGEQDIAWAVIATSPRTNFECHACTPVLSMFVYHKENDRTWQLQKSAFKAFKGGSGWDNPPDPKKMALVHLSPTYCALAIRTGYANMGWGMTYYTLVAAEASGGRTLFSTTMSEENSGEGRGKKTDWKSSIEIKPQQGRSYYSISLHRQGVYENTPIDYTVQYDYNGSQYLPQGEDLVMQKR